MAGSTKADFYVWGEDKATYGPIELPELVSWFEQERVTADTWVFVDNHGTWERAGQLPELRRLFARKAEHASGLTPLQVVQGLDIRLLRRLKVLADFSDEQLTRFSTFLEVQSVPQWATIVKQGDRGNAMYVVVEGELSVRLKVDGTDNVLAKLCMGDFFGDIALFDYGPRSADVVAETSAVLLRLSATAFAELVERCPELATPFLLAIARTLSVRIRTANKHAGEAAKYVRTTAQLRGEEAQVHRAGPGLSA